ncbi:MAG: molybdopterin biosynthesis protein, partial [Litoreibacter sp.]|nr:molybdopterin biosynthesis protein [Litoreibacter sp.]
MFLVFFLAAVIFVGGRWLGLPRRALNSILVVLFTAVLFFQLTLPDGNPLKDATGGSLKNWLVLAGAASLVLAYRWALQRLRNRAAPSEDPAPKR